MSQNDPSPVAQPPDRPVDKEALSNLRQKIFGTMLDQLRPWLLEFGNWIFGGLIGFNLVIFAVVLYLAAAATSPIILLSLAAFVCALPLDVSGLIALKLVKDMETVAIDDVMKQAFQDAHIPPRSDTLPVEEADAIQKRRANLGLRYAGRLMAISAILTLLGMVAALWYVASWVAVLFLVVVLITLLITMSITPQLMRPPSEAEKQLRMELRQQRHK
jgi:hypothetical protein